MAWHQLNFTFAEIEVLDKCPEFQLVVPCQCRERKSGLDITCENVETEQLKSVTDNMKKYKKRQDFTVTIQLKICFPLKLIFYKNKLLQSK